MSQFRILFSFATYTHAIVVGLEVVAFEIVLKDVDLR